MSYGDRVDIDPKKFKDEWAAIEAAKVQQLLQADHLRHERKTLVLQGFGYVCGALIVAAVIGGIIFAAWKSADNNRLKVIRLEQEQTERVNSCIKIEEPTQRQLCLLSLDQSNNNQEDK